jgi:hypothetical protein
MQTPPDYAAATAVSTLAGCVNRRVFVQPRAHDTSWRKPCNLWGAIIGHPGLLKSPVMEAVARPPFQVEALWRTEYERALSDYEFEAEKAEIRKQAWRESYKRETKQGNPEPIRPDFTIKKPIHRRLVLQDSTFEKLHEILAENPAGVMVMRDELTGWLSELDRPGREGERAFCLSAWNGTTGHSIERIGRGSIFVPACCVSLFGGIQPSRLRTYLQDALDDGPANDGLIQRFQILVWPDVPDNWRLIDRTKNEEAESQVRRVFETLAGLSADEPILMRFSTGAQRLFDAWLTELETKLRNRDTHPALIAHLSKYRSLMLVLSALFELADWAAGQPNAPGKVTVVGSDRGLGNEFEISLAHAQQAAGYCDYLESHARRVYSCIASPELRGARELGRHLRQGDMGRRFTVRQVYQRDWSGLTTPSRVRSALELLQDAGWVGPITAEDGMGRPSEAYEVNPGLEVTHR